MRCFGRSELDGNSLTGCIPSELSALTRLEYLCVALTARLSAPAMTALFSAACVIMARGPAARLLTRRLFVSSLLRPPSPPGGWISRRSGNYKGIV